MEHIHQVTAINRREVIYVVKRTLALIDSRLVDHGERVLFIVSQIFEQGNLQETMDWQKLAVLSVLHDIGAYKTEEIDQMLEFETGDTWDHAVYGYLFLKNMSPLEEFAEGVLYHHYPYKKYDKISSDYLDYAAIIHLADRIDILIQTKGVDCVFEQYLKKELEIWDPKLIDIFLEAQKKHHIKEQILTGVYRKAVEQIIGAIDLTTERAMDYLKMLVYSIDFRSEHTVTHTINTTAISVEIARLFQVDQADIEKVYVGAFLHDIGKIAIPWKILEHPGRLSEDQMSVMKTHVDYTEQIIGGLVDEEIVHIAIRHHEKLDGSGYSYGLNDCDMSLLDKIVAVADIVSALGSRRSYKEVFPKEMILHIIREMKEDGKLDPEVCEMVLKNFDQIMHKTDMNRDPVVKMYKQIFEEYEELQREIASRAADEGKICKENMIERQSQS